MVPLVVGVTVVLLLAGAGAAVALTRGDSERTGVVDTAPVTTAQDTPTAAQDIAVHVRNDLVPLQTELNVELKALTRGVTPMRGTVRAARRLETGLLQLQGWTSARVAPQEPGDAAALKLFRLALARHAAYANLVAGLPADSTRITKWSAERAIARAAAARESYIRLHGAAPAIPVVALPDASQERLRTMIEKPAPPPPDTTTTTTSADPSTEAGVAAIRSVITAHWDAINSGSYYDAYAYFSSRFKSRNTSSGWVGDKNADRPTSSAISISSFVPHGNYATAYVSFSTRGLETSPGNTGCNRWDGSYTLVKSGGSWYIDASHLDRTSLNCG